MNLPSIWRLLKTKSILVLVSFSWISVILILFTISSVFDKSPNEQMIVPSVRIDPKYDKLNDRLNDANHQIELLMSQNRDLAKHLRLLNGLKKKRPTLFANIESQLSNTFPTSEFEQSLRRVKQNLNEIWDYLSKKLDSRSKPFAEEWRYNMVYDINTISQRDNRWRVDELKGLTQFVQNRIERLQNPNDCTTAKKLVCDLNKNCGFGCQMHHLAHCLVAAMALNRTLVANTHIWRTNSANDNVWNKVFQPLSDSCLDSDGQSRTHWKEGDLSSYQVIQYPIADFIDPIPNFFPLVIPQQIAEPIMRMSGQPFIWFIGQVLNYIMRSSDMMREYILDFKLKNQFKHPIVGIHVRRTDKIGTEAKFHSIDEYMHYVNDFYNKLDLERERNSITEKIERRVYLATDEPDVWREEITPYEQKGYKFIGDIKMSESADPMQRHGFDSLHNVIVDLMLLSQSDHIVCTFSSQICRLAFELMQTRVTAEDMSLAYYSIDDIYYFGGQRFHGKKALVNHTAQNSKELSFEAGDILGIANTLHNGYNYGDHNRTEVMGLYPGFKVAEYVESVPFAVFD